MKKSIKMSLIGAVTGFANGLFGSGGGIVAVPMLKKTGLETKKAHSSSLAVTLPLSFVSAMFYFINNDSKLDIIYSLKLIPFGLAGALIGTHFMEKIPAKVLSRIFGVLLIIAGGRNLFI